MHDTEADEQRWAQAMSRALQGDRQAYDELLRELSVVIRNYLSARFGRFDIIDDCVQECLLAIHQGRHSYDPKRPFRPWMFAIVRHRTIDMIRRTRTATEYTEQPVTTPDHSLELDGARLLQQLPEGIRDVLMMTKFLGMSTAETARQLAVSESVVKVRVHRGVRKLRRIWQLER